jgi:hypothetical protein
VPPAAPFTPGSPLSLLTSGFDHGPPSCLTTRASYSANQLAAPTGALTLLPSGDLLFTRPGGGEPVWQSGTGHAGQGPYTACVTRAGALQVRGPPACLPARAMPLSPAAWTERAAVYRLCCGPPRQR